MDWPLCKKSGDGKTLECWNYVLGKDTPVSLLVSFLLLSVSGTIITSLLVARARPWPVRPRSRKLNDRLWQTSV